LPPKKNLSSLREISRSEKIVIGAVPPQDFKTAKEPVKNIDSPARLWREPYFNFGGRKFFNPNHKIIFNN